MHETFGGTRFPGVTKTTRIGFGLSTIVSDVAGGPRRLWRGAPAGGPIGARAARNCSGLAYARQGRTYSPIVVDAIEFVAVSLASTPHSSPSATNARAAVLAGVGFADRYTAPRRARAAAVHGRIRRQRSRVESQPRRSCQRSAPTVSSEFPTRISKNIDRQRCPCCKGEWSPAVSRSSSRNQPHSCAPAAAWRLRKKRCWGIQENPSLSKR
jgi:hypothetical protein